VARFPDQNEYQISTSEFNQMKSRLVSLTPCNAWIGDPGKPTSSGVRHQLRAIRPIRAPAPTGPLKRRQSSPGLDRL
jgi:hypothetical protein